MGIRDTLLAEGHCKGSVGSPDECPIALYIRKQTKAYVKVCHLFTQSYRHGYKLIYNPPTVEAFVEQFDRGMIPELIGSPDYSWSYRHV